MMSLNDLNRIFQTSSEVCNGAQQVVNTAQMALNNVQDISRRTIPQMQVTNPYGTAMIGDPTGQPINFTPYPGFWNENYGR